MGSRMYAQLERIKRATDLDHDADENLKRAQKRYKSDYDGRVRLAPIF